MQYVYVIKGHTDYPMIKHRTKHKCAHILLQFGIFIQLDKLHGKDSGTFHLIPQWFVWKYGIFGLYFIKKYNRWSKISLNSLPYRRLSIVIHIHKT